VKTSDVAPPRRQVPATGGLNAGSPDVVATGADRSTVTTWSEGTPVAPVAGTVLTTASGRGLADRAGPAVVPLDEDAGVRLRPNA